MNYVGRVLSSVKGFYNDINPATLTGAIDVIIIKQEDGTYLSSPWHVRFGKMGVMRAKQKVVDIEVNGESVDLRMKLGDAGEAFFVQEADEDITDIPGYLATSPLLSSLELIEKGLQRIKAEQAASGSDLLIPGHSVITIPDDIDGNLSLLPAPPSSLPPEDPSSQAPGEAFRRETLTGYPVAIQRTPTKLSVSTQTVMTSMGGKSSKQMGEDAAPGVVTDSVVSQAPTRHRRKKSKAMMRFDRASLGGSAASLATAPLTDVKTSENGMTSTASEECLFEMELADEGEDDDDKSFSALEMSSLGRTLSLSKVSDPSIRLMNSSWVSRQFSTSFHSFSDVECTPLTSPRGSRPSSPKSDTEVTLSNHDATCQTQLTGDRFPQVDDILWKWGMLPEQPSANNSSQLASVEQGHVTHAVAGLLKPDTNTNNVSKNSVSSPKKDALSFAGGKEGVYLDDITGKQDDPEITALYLYGPGSSQCRPIKTMISNDNEDNESGNGQSLPQSPITVEPDLSSIAAAGGSNAMFPSDGKPPLPLRLADADVALSLCGGLEERDGERMSAQFELQRVTYETICTNPNILNDPNLVVRCHGKYYNWKIAGPMFATDLVFKQPLCEAAMSVLTAQHLPKKVEKKSWYDWSWRSRKPGNADPASISASKVNLDSSSKDVGTSPRSGSQSLSPDPMNRRAMERSAGKYTDILSSDDEGEFPGVSVSIVGDITTEAGDLLNASGAVRDKYMKSLKLSTEQIAKLNLSEGMNEASFSVTTQYQGTARCACYIFLWNWNDKIVISDIDGTITKSDVLGQVLPIIGHVLPLISNDWSQVGIANLYSMINNNGYRFLYLSARAIGQSRLTRDYLRSLRQGELSLPDGPLLLSPSSLVSAFHREVIERKPEVFKISCLTDIKQLFSKHHDPFFAGFGNKINDVWAYRAVGVPLDRIFTVNHRGQLRVETLLSYQSSYSRLSDIVDHFFPPLPNTPTQQNGNKFTEYNSFMFWREELPDLSDEISAFVKKSEEDKANEKKKPSVKKKMDSKPTSAPPAASVKKPTVKK